MRSAFRGGVTLVPLYLALVASPVVADDRPGETPCPPAEVTYLDGSTARVETPGFVFVWVYKGDGDRDNDTADHRTRSTELHYRPATSGAESDEVLPCTKISRIELSYTKYEDVDGYFTADRIAVIRVDGGQLSLKEQDFYRLGSDFLQRRPRDDIKDSSVFKRLEFVGQATVGGQREEFAAEITAKAAASSPASERISEIVFVPTH